MTYDKAKELRYKVLNEPGLFEITKEPYKDLPASVYHYRLAGTQYYWNGFIFYLLDKDFKQIKVSGGIEQILQDESIPYELFCHIDVLSGIKEIEEYMDEIESYGYVTSRL